MTDLKEARETGGDSPRYQMPFETLTMLRGLIGEDLVGNTRILSFVIGDEGMISLRRHYFPRFRFGWVDKDNPVSQGRRKVTTADVWERNLIEALAPPADQLNLSVVIELPADLSEIPYTKPPMTAEERAGATALGELLTQLN